MLKQAFPSLGHLPLVDILLKQFRSVVKLGLVAQTCNPSYLRSRETISTSRSVWAISKNISKYTGVGGLGE